ncbi:hypothetical protein E2C01_079924 [Portunus trituberculatus]|uniref:Uncharacterized protein n=1 Tax=Portunus trituberculatus TaxID=210409 RepID=A0A5B7II54_PORTR|nr:hypothetical protein [Portunus trituberculatus]
MKTFYRSCIASPPAKSSALNPIAALGVTPLNPAVPSYPAKIHQGEKRSFASAGLRCSRRPLLTIPPPAKL